MIKEDIKNSPKIEVMNSHYGWRNLYVSIWSVFGALGAFFGVGAVMYDNYDARIIAATICFGIASGLEFHNAYDHHKKAKKIQDEISNA